MLPEICLRKGEPPGMIGCGDPFDWEYESFEVVKGITTKFYCFGVGIWIR